MRRIGLLACLGLALASVASAGIITTGTWGPASSASFGVSWDGPQEDVSSRLAGIPGLEYLTASGFAVSDLNATVTLVNETADYASIDRLGWHDAYGGAFGDIFGGSAVPGATSVVHPSVLVVGFWLLSPDAPYVFSSLDTQQFALFRTVTPSLTTYYLGIEDLWVGDGQTDRDYNDLIVSWSESPVTTVPEPATCLLVGTGLLWVARKRRG